MTQAIPSRNGRRSVKVSIRRAATAAAVVLAVNAAGWQARLWPAETPAAEAAEPVQVQVSGGRLLTQPVLVGGSTEPALAASSAGVPAELAVSTVPSVAAVTPPQVWKGTVGQEGYVRAAPSTSAPRVGELQPGQAVKVLRWVSGEEVEKENSTWADLGDGRYAYSALLRSRTIEAAPAPPVNAPTKGRWIDVNLTLQVATAYEGTSAVKSVLISTGRPGWDTPRGTFAIQRRVAKETMDGRTLVGQGPNGAGATYKVENVRWTQYFTADGSAIHENYWRNPALFGMPGSHGCVGMRSADAAWFWEFATSGTPVVIH